MTNPVKLSQEYQDQWKDNNLNNKFIVVNNISYKVQLHKEMENTLCSAAACLNVLGNLDSNIDDLKKLFK